jgi:squalene cyclase
MRAAVLLLAGAGLSAAPGRAQDLAVPVQPKGITQRTTTAIERGLKYLAREQDKDGAWKTAGGYGSYPVAMSALAGLALMASGSTPTRGPYAENVRKATRYILTEQQPNGLIAAVAEEMRSMYGHGFSTLFLAQVYGTEEDQEKQRRIKEALQRAVRLIERSQSRDGGWLYTPDANGDEGSVTVTQV